MSRHGLGGNIVGSGVRGRIDAAPTSQTLVIPRQPLEMMRDTCRHKCMGKVIIITRRDVR